MTSIHRILGPLLALASLLGCQTADSRAPEQPQEHPPRAFAPGRFQLRLTAAIHPTDHPATPSESEQAGLVLQGTMNLATVEALEGRLKRLQLQVEVARLSGDPAAARLRRSLERPCIIEVKDGRLLAIQHARPRHARSEAILESVLSSLQVGRPVPGAAELADGTGMLLTQHDWKGDNLVKQGIRYTTVFDGKTLAKPDAGAFEVERSSTKLHFSGGALSRASGFASMSATVDRSLPRLRSTWHWSLWKVDGALPAKQGGRLDTAPAEPLYARPAPGDRTVELDLAKAGTLTIESALGELISLKQEPGDDARHRRDRLKIGLAALARLDDDGVSKLAAAVDGALGIEIVEVLGRVGRPKAEAVLAAVFADRSKPAEIRKGALVALSLSRSPTDKTLTLLVSLLDGPHHRQACFGLGSVAFHAQAENPQVADAAVAQLTQRLLQATDRTGMLLYLRALSNSGHPRLIEVLRPFYTSQNPELRREAYRTLRRVKPSWLVPLLRAAAQTDEDETVRQVVSELLRQASERSAQG